MSGLLGQLRAATHCAATARHDLMLAYKPADNSVHIIVENREDESFFSSAIRHSAPPGWAIHFHWSGGKEQAIEIYRSIHWGSYKKSRVWFIFDRDHDEYLGIPPISDENIVTTAWYSIESHLVTATVFERVLTEIFHIKNKQILDACIEKFIVSHIRTTKYLHGIAVVLMAARRAGIKIIYKNIDVFSFAALNDDWILLRGSPRIAAIRGICAAYNIKIGDIVSMLRLLKGVEAKRVIPGKLELAWFIRVLKVIRNEAEEKGYRIVTQLNESNIMEIVGPRIDPPENIKVFFAAGWKRLTA